MLAQRADDPLLPIAAVERETGLGKDTLRAWERRYGFPVPVRDAAGVRGYPRPLVDRLALIRRALLAGERPGRLLALPPAELDVLLAALPARTIAPAAGGTPLLDVDEGLAALRAGGPEALRHWLTLGLARSGLAAFVVDGLAPLMAAVGQARRGGRIAVYEEHLYGQALEAILRSALVPFQAGLQVSPPRVLLATVPVEAHGLGLRLAEAVLTLQACHCLSLGTQTPLADIADAAAAHRIDVVALSLPAGLSSPQVSPALAELRARLSDTVAVWAVIASPAPSALRVPGIRVMAGLAGIPEAVAQWREAAAG